MKNEYEKGVEIYNQLLENKAAVEKENKKLLQEVENQKVRVLRIELK